MATTSGPDTPPLHTALHDVVTTVTKQLAAGLGELRVATQRVEREALDERDQARRQLTANAVQRAGAGDSAIATLLESARTGFAQEDEASKARLEALGSSIASWTAGMKALDALLAEPGTRT